MVAQSGRMHGRRRGRSHVTPVECGAPIFQPVVICHQPLHRETTDPPGRQHRVSTEVKLLSSSPSLQTRRQPMVNDGCERVYRHSRPRDTLRAKMLPATGSLAALARIQILLHAAHGRISSTAFPAANAVNRLVSTGTVLAQGAPRSDDGGTPCIRSGLPGALFRRARSARVPQRQRRHGATARNLFQKEGARACNLNLCKRLLTSTQRPPTRQTQPRLPRRAEKCTDNSQRQEPQDHVPNVTLSRSDLCLWAHRLPQSPLASSYTPRLSDDTLSRCSHNSFQQTNVGPTQLTGTNLK
jgi:hypothetical protein